MRSELSGLKGGKKQIWLRLHRKEVEAFYYAHGAEATLAEFNMSQTTLEDFFKRKNTDERNTRLSQADRYIMEYARQSAAEVRARVRVLEDWRAEVTPIIEVGRALLNATMQPVISKVENTPLSNDPLSIKQLSGKSGK